MEASSAARSYRPEIDGLRAVAVIAVVLFHAFEGIAPGGFVGVDVFFVISGFLISGIILRTVEQGTFTLSDFYARRIRRILPALLLVLVGCLLAGSIFWLADEWEALGRHVFAGALFHANIAVAREGGGGYFVALGGRNPLLHLWSLGVEEQFYFVWPLLFAALVRWTRRPLIGVLAILALSFLLNLAWVFNEPTKAYFLPFPRLWELLVGATLVFVNRPLRRAEAEVAGTLGIGLIVAACVLFDWAVTFPGWRALAPTVGAALVILAGQRAWVGRTVLSASPVVWLGLISYPLYLWHWPLLIFGKAIWLNARFWPGRLWLVAASVVLAYLTYRVVESRVRSTRGPAVPIALLVALVATAIVGQVVADGRIESRLTRITPSAPQLIHATGDWSYPYPANFRKKSGFVGGEYNPERARAVLFIGDSYLEQYWARVKHLIDEAPSEMPTVRFFTRGACVPLRHRESRGPICGRFLDDALAAATDPLVDTVVIGAFWESYFRTGRVGDAAVRPLIRINSKTADDVLAEFGAMVRSLRNSGKQVFVLLNGPTDPAFDPRFLVSRVNGKRIDAPVMVAPWRQQVGPILDRVSAVATAAGAVVIDPVPFICDDGVCQVIGPEGEPTHADRGHMRPWYVVQRATFLDQVLRASRVR
ncbi:MAG TPA: acyltransferase family protein [Vicinamibacterales bacterium]|nr:acyltransferase family protein [Vicinamibacterales bacterium]